MKIEHVIHTHYECDYPFTESHYIKFGVDLIVEAVNEKVGDH